MKKILNPIEFFNDKKLLLINLIIFVCGTLLSVALHATFESPIGLHFSEKMVPAQTFSGNTISIISLCLAFFLAAKIINRKTRFIDCLNLAMYLRIPYYFLTLINLFFIFGDQTSNKNIDKETNLFNDITELVIGYSMAFLLISFLVVIGISVYRSFKTICNAKKTTDYLLLIGSILIFIITSSLIIKNI